MAEIGRTGGVVHSSARIVALAVLGGVGILASRQSAGAADADQPTTVPSGAPTVDFAKDIQPIFQESCVKCHQLHPTNGSARPSAGFRLDDKAAALKGGRKGHDIVPGDSAKSTLYGVLKGRFNGIDQMPAAPRGQEATPLADEKIALIKAWIDQGANWPAAPTTAPSASAN
jgi:uncharacterized membrane protein